MTDPNTTPGTMPPDMVTSILLDPDCPLYPSQITVFCDHCGTEDTADYMVSEDMTPTERLAVARRHLVEHKGWQHDADTGDDFCPAHAAPKATTTEHAPDVDLRAMLADLAGRWEQMAKTTDNSCADVNVDAEPGVAWIRSSRAQTYRRAATDLREVLDSGRIPHGLMTDAELGG
jgi:hypothetical protein